MFKMYLSYDRKDKRKFRLSKLTVFLLIILMGYLSTVFSKIELPSLKEQLNFGSGLILILIVVVLAIFNRLSILFKVKSVGFLIVFLILLFFRYHIDTLVITTGLITIPLLLDDLVINNYFKYLNVTKYWDVYKHIGIRDA